MDLLNNIFNDPDCQPTNQQDRKRKLKASERQAAELKRAKAAEEAAEQQRTQKRLEHQASLSRVDSEEAAAAHAPTAELQAQEADAKQGRRLEAKPDVFRRVLVLRQVEPAALALSGAAELLKAFLPKAQTLGLTELEQVLASALIEGLWIVPHCQLQGRCSRDMAELLFQTVIRSSDLGQAAAAQQQLVSLVQLAATAPSSANPKAQHTHELSAQLHMDWVPDAAAFQSAFVTLGLDPSSTDESKPASHAEAASQQGAIGTPAQPEEQATAASLHTGNIQLVVQLLRAICQQQAASKSDWLQAKPLAKLVVSLFQLSLDDAALGLASDIEEAIAAAVAALDESAWAVEVSRIAKGIAACGGSHQGALGIVQRLSAHVPRLAALQQHAAAALLCSLAFCKGQRKVRALSPLDVTAVIQGMPWFSDDAAAGEMLAKRACQAHDSPVSGWELHTSLEAIDMMLTPLLADAEEQDDSPEHLTADGHSAGFSQEFAKQLSRLLARLERTLRRCASDMDHAARASAFLASKLRERLTAALSVNHSSLYS